MNIFNDWKAWDPLVARFEARLCSPSNRTKDETWIRNIAQELKECDSVETYVQRFVDVCFAADASSSNHPSSMKLKELDFSLEIFVSYFWILYRNPLGSDGEADTLLFKHRKRLGFYDTPTNLTYRFLYGDDGEDANLVSEPLSYETGKQSPSVREIHDDHVKPGLTVDNQLQSKKSSAKRKVLEEIESDIRPSVRRKRKAENVPSTDPHSSLHKVKPKSRAAVLEEKDCVYQGKEAKKQKARRKKKSTSSEKNCETSNILEDMGSTTISGTPTFERTMPATARIPQYPVHRNGGGNYTPVAEGDKDHTQLSQPPDNAHLSPQLLSGAKLPVIASIPRSPRPPLPVSPPIWAQSRQELCESCDYFRSFQGGVYHTKGFAKGYLLGGYPSLRDLFHENGKLIISHGGGKAASKLVEAEDQSHMDHSVSALLKTHELNQPIVLIIDDKYAEFPLDLTRSGKEGYSYVVLGHYLIRNWWTELQPADNPYGFAVRYKFAFQWCSKTEPWWISGMDAPTVSDVKIVPRYPHPSEPGIPPKYDPGYAKCGDCGKKSPWIYQQWMCLHPQCGSFFQISSSPATHMPLQYLDQFLQLEVFHDITVPNICPNQPLHNPDDGITTTAHFLRGWHCQNCGRLSSRVKWECWECAACNRVLKVTGTIRSHKDFWGVVRIADYDHHSIDPKSGIVSPGLRTHSGSRLGYFTFILPNNWGKVHMIVSNALSNKQANDIFQDYQKEANKGTLPFRRFPLKAHQCRGTLLTNYFSQNCGAPYQYVGGADRTLPFDQCPSCVTRAVDLIEERAFLVLDERPRFNELLNCAYMEKQNMSFHADNEKGLGPIVSSLSMGSPAIMRFRGTYDKKVVLSLVLRHGDVIVMEGAGVQQHYEHTVVPCGFRIAATARTIEDSNQSKGAWR